MKEKIYKIVSLFSFFKFQENLILELKDKLLNIENKNEAKNDRVFNYQDPINITSNSLNCLNEKIIIEFENEINIQYLRIIQDANDLFQNVKIININAYS